MLDLTQAWSEAVHLLSGELSKPAYDAWLRTAQPLAFHDNLLLVAVPNSFAKTYLQGRVADRLATVLSAILHAPVALDFVVSDNHDPDEQAAAADPLPAPSAPHPALNPRYTFDTFVVGASNRFAHAAALAVADAPGRAYNPLFIYGGVGLGKTHLIQAIAHHILARQPRARIVYVTCETFTNELINAIRDGRQIHFRNRYRNVDALLIDDVHFLEGKETTQQEMFHTFNTLHEARRQIVLSSDRPPKDIPTLEERLRSRFEWGLLSDIQPPDLETRIAILQKKAQLEGITIPNEVLQYLASRIESNIRELEGALIRLIAYASVNHRPFTVEVAELALADLFPAPAPRPLTIPLIQKVVAEYYHLDPRELSLRRRSRDVVLPRHIAMYLARELTRTSLPAIGAAFGGRDHTTVLHACEKIAADLANDPALAATVSHLRRLLTS